MRPTAEALSEVLLRCDVLYSRAAVLDRSLHALGGAALTLAFDGIGRLS